MHTVAKRQILNTGVIADYDLVYDATMFKDKTVQEALNEVFEVVEAALDSLKNLTVREFPVDDKFIEETSKDQLDDESKF